MFSIQRLLVACLAFTAGVAPVNAFPAFGPGALSSTLGTRATCSGSNTADDRSSWCDGFDINTNYHDEAPDTGVTREYWLELVNTTLAPDGVERIVLTVNGTLPGPTIFADWGDTVVVHVKNGFTDNGTSIHWHGIRQNYTNDQDGVASVTQCPTAPGETVTYTWRAVQYGSTWYHSHFSLQAWEGVFGGVIINGPASSNYDHDAGVLFLTDWSHETVDALWETAQTSGAPVMENALINGTNVYESDDGEVGSRFSMAVTAGDSYRLRLVNSAIDTHFKFMVDNHTLTVIGNDLVPIEPYNTTMVNIFIGQRYDVILTANQEDIGTDFWMRAIPQDACSDNDSTDNIKGILHYGTSTADATDPTTTGYSYTDECVDEPYESLVPIVSATASSSTYDPDETASVTINSENHFRWTLNSYSFFSEWEDPTLLQIYNNDTVYNATQNVIEVPDANVWVYLVIETSIGVPHPIHLHGHDFLLIGYGTGTYDPDNTTVQLSNPPRRDTATLPGTGYIIMAFETDNPGAWLTHCHIGWHTSEGFALQFIERYDEILATVDTDALTDSCTVWTAYAEENDIEEEDSGV